MINPVHQNEDGTWWFWDETWAVEYGPYDDQGECENALEDYAVNVLGVGYEEDEFLD